MTGLIITGGSINCAFAGAFLKIREFDMVIAVDGGLAAVKSLNIRPDAIVGDFDTVKGELLEEYRRMGGIAFEQHQPEKDETDTELALRTAMEAGVNDIVLLGATGGRLDHSIGNLHLPYACLQKGVKASIVDEKNRLYILDQGKTYRFGEIWGKYISFLPLTEEVHGITLKGFKYPLTDRDIRIGTSLCISNELAEKTGTITFRDGVLICVESHD
ncbi:thiamine diphosphokinase [Hungatella sp.]|uniref:thiamine diphosphokinase n=1 Tax=Hungatella sp. TaxID=2613924 RepID=UPI003AB522F4